MAWGSWEEEEGGGGRRRQKEEEEEEEEELEGFRLRRRFRLMIR